MTDTLPHSASLIYRPRGTAASKVLEILVLLVLSGNSTQRPELHLKVSYSITIIVTFPLFELQMKTTEL
jgi:hypothetical protein